MMLGDYLCSYYLFERIPNTKAKTRLDCTLSTGDCPFFEERRAPRDIHGTRRDTVKAGQLILYFNQSRNHIRHAPQARRLADVCLSIKGHNLTSLYDYCRLSANKWMAYGDIPSTHDAVVVVYEVQMQDGAVTPASYIKVFVFRGMAARAEAVCAEMCSGRMNARLNAVIRGASAEPTAATAKAAAQEPTAIPTAAAAALQGRA